MAKKLFVGNLDWATTDEELQALFAEYGEVEEAIILKDKFSGRSRGFGFVTYVNDEDADKAVEALNETDFKGRNIVVNEAKPPRERD
ncbi:RNA-binding protein [Patescibacteria group bacterium]|nr:RNA-binding protein [Patescibacteria group bacterium]